jgi:hypothetical protein
MVGRGTRMAAPSISPMAMNQLPMMPYRDPEPWPVAQIARQPDSGDQPNARGDGASQKIRIVKTRIDELYPEGEHRPDDDRYRRQEPRSKALGSRQDQTSGEIRNRRGQAKSGGRRRPGDDDGDQPVSCSETDPEAQNGKRGGESSLPRAHERQRAAEGEHRQRALVTEDYREPSALQHASLRDRVKVSHRYDGGADDRDGRTDPPQEMWHGP